MKHRHYWMLSVVVLLAACQPAPAPVQAWKTLDGIAVSVDTAMRAANDMYQANRLSEAQKNEIIAAHDIYRPIAQAAHAAVKAWMVADPEAQTVTDDVAQKIADTTAAGQYVIRVAKGHGVKP